MMIDINRATLALALLMCAGHSIAQQPLLIPDTLSGEEIDLVIQNGSFEFIEGTNTTTMGINQGYLGPIVFLNAGDSVQFHVENMLDEMSSMHWHGLHVPAAKDGGPHQMIEMMETWSPKFKVMDRAGCYWFHPHSHLSTLKQATFGAAGMIIIRDEEEAAIELPRAYGVDDFPIVLTSFHLTAANQIFWASSDINTSLVNGRVDGFLDVPAQVVRLRLLDASNHLSYAIGLSNGMSFSVIASDGGLLESPVNTTRLNISAGERYEILIDLTGHEDEVIEVMSYGTELPDGWPGGDMMANMTNPTSLDDLDYQLFELHVGQQTSDPVITIPSTLGAYEPWDVADVQTRPFVLTGDGVMTMNFAINGTSFDMDVINETTVIDHTEIWHITNNSIMGHPFHVHGNSFYVIEWNGNPVPDYMKCKKDVVMIPPISDAKIAIRFEDFVDDVLPYMYHCHILSHEDLGGMMGQYVVTNGLMVSNEQDLYAGIYPNPIAGGTSFRINSDLMSGIVEIYDATGRSVYCGKWTGQSRQIDAPVDPGVYLLRLTGQAGSKAMRFVVE